MAADEHERARPPKPSLGALVGTDQKRQPLHRCEAAQVEEDRRGGEGGKLLLPIGDASGLAIAVPALRVLDQPAPPEATPGFAGERSGLEAIQLDAAGETVQSRALEPEQGRDPGRHQTLEGSIINRRENPVGATRPILVGGLEGNGGGERISKLQRRRVIDRGDLGPGVEAGRVRRLPRRAERAARERHPPPLLWQRQRERACDLRRATAREEKQRRADTTRADTTRGLEPCPPLRRRPFR